MNVKAGNLRSLSKFAELPRGPLLSLIHPDGLSPRLLPFQVLKNVAVNNRACDLGKSQK